MLPTGVRNFFLSQKHRPKLGEALFVTKVTVPTWEDYFLSQKCLSQVGTTAFHFKNAGKLLYNKLKAYVGIASLPVSQETAAIKGMLLDLRKPEFAEAVTTLGLTAYMNELERLNNLYEELVAKRSTARSAKSIGTDSRTVRQEMNSLYEDMNDLAFASNLLNGTDETAAFIRSVNTLIAETRTARNQRGNKKKGEGGGAGDERPGEL